MQEQRELGTWEGLGAFQETPGVVGAPPPAFPTARLGLCLQQQGSDTGLVHSAENYLGKGKSFCL